MVGALTAPRHCAALRFGVPGHQERRQLMAFERGLDCIGEQIAMRPRAQRTIDMDGLAAHAPQGVEVQIESTVDFPLMASTKEMHERHAPPPHFDSPVMNSSPAVASDVRRTCGMAHSSQFASSKRQFVPVKKPEARRYCLIANSFD
jgi:hypothetical protein